MQMPIEREFEIVEQWFEVAPPNAEWSPQLMVEHPNDAGETQLTVLLLPWTDEDEKVFMLRIAAVQCRVLKATEVRILSDVWMSKAKAREHDPNLMPRDDPDHEEAIVAVTVSKDEMSVHARSYVTENGKKVWGEIEDISGGTGFLQNTLKMIWEMPEPPEGIIEVLAKEFGFVLQMNEMTA